jgi:hypothetical protein
MPKTPIDYSHTFIYKICCKDPTIIDVYVGHTTNVVKRRHKHKYSCNTETHKTYSLYVYQFIRDNGGWDNWDMIVLIELTCKDKNEALREERKYLEELKATLNKQIPTRTNKEWNTDNKEIQRIKKKEYYETNKEIRLDQMKEYRENNREKILEYRERNKDKLNELKRLYRLKQKQEKETIG